jgi:hypothetical protein
MPCGILCCEVGPLFQDYQSLKRKTLRFFRSSLFCDITQCWLVVSDRSFGRTSLFRNVDSYPSTLRNIPEERRHNLHRHGSPKSQTVILLNILNNLIIGFEFSVTPLRDLKSSCSELLFIWRLNHITQCIRVQWNLMASNVYTSLDRQRVHEH